MVTAIHGSLSDDNGYLHQLWRHHPLESALWLGTFWYLQIWDIRQITDLSFTYSLSEHSLVL